jgi:hypothetical protein
LISNPESEPSVTLYRRAREGSHTLSSQNKLILGTGAGLLGAYVITSVIGKILSSLVSIIGFAYPAYESLEAIESKNGKDERKWMTYWIAYGAFQFSDNIFFWVPFYYHAKTVCLVPI